MVYRRAESVDRAPADFPREQRGSLQSASTAGSSSAGPQALSHGMQIVRSHFNSLITAFHHKLQILSCLPGNQVH